MENVTIGQIGATIALIVGLITGVRYLKKSIKEWITESLRDSFDSLRKEVINLQERIAEVDMSACKNYLVRSLADLDRGEQWDEIEKERFYEQYEHYVKHGGNSYIRQKVERFKNAGML